MPDVGVVFKSMPSMVWVVLALVVALKVFLLWWNNSKNSSARPAAIVQRSRAAEGRTD